jgi:hypothetical protein
MVDAIAMKKLAAEVTNGSFVTVHLKKHQSDIYSLCSISWQ